MPCRVEPTHLGGTVNVHFKCSRREIRLVSFQGSSFVEGSKRTVVGLALGVAFFLTGHVWWPINAIGKICTE